MSNIYHHYTKSEWPDGAALYVINKVELPVGSELVVISEALEAFTVYTIEANGDVRSSNWSYAQLPDNIGMLVWDLL